MLISCCFSFLLIILYLVFCFVFIYFLFLISAFCLSHFKVVLFVWLIFAFVFVAVVVVVAGVCIYKLEFLAQYHVELVVVVVESRYNNLYNMYLLQL